MLSNGNSGVFFNDCTKIILDPTTNTVEYIEKKNNDKLDSIVSFNLEEYP